MIRQTALSFVRPLAAAFGSLLIAAHVGGCALEVDPESSSVPTQRTTEAITAASNLEAQGGEEPTRLEEIDDGSSAPPWTPGEDHNSGDPNPLPWQPDPLPWTPDPLPWQPDEARSGEPEELAAPEDARSSHVTQKVEAAIDER